MSQVVMSIAISNLEFVKYLRLSTLLIKNIVVLEQDMEQKIWICQGTVIYKIRMYQDPIENVKLNHPGIELPTQRICKWNILIRNI